MVDEDNMRKITTCFSEDQNEVAMTVMSTNVVMCLFCHILKKMQKVRRMEIKKKIQYK